MPAVTFPIESADDDGLVFIGGDLEPDTILAAYRQGVFPTRFFPLGESDPMHWWSPDPRAIIELKGLHVSRRLIRTIKTGRWSASVNADFAGVIRGCADRPTEGTWLTGDMIDAYERLHRMGHAHSVEIWSDGKLVGGTYGLALGGLFAAESMFHRVTDASKIALLALVQRLNERGFHLLDIQLLSPHTERMGAIEIPRSEYLARLRIALSAFAVFA